MGLIQEANNNKLPTSVSGWAQGTIWELGAAN